VLRGNVYVRVRVVCSWITKLSLSSVRQFRVMYFGQPVQCHVTYGTVTFPDTENHHYQNTLLDHRWTACPTTPTL